MNIHLPAILMFTIVLFGSGSLNVPIEHHLTIRYMVYNGYHKVMSNIPKMGQLPTPDLAEGKLTMKHRILGYLLSEFNSNLFARCKDP